MEQKVAEREASDILSTRLVQIMVFKPESGHFVLILLHSDIDDQA